MTFDIAPNVRSVGSVMQVVPGEFPIVMSANQGYGARAHGTSGRAWGAWGA